MSRFLDLDADVADSLSQSSYSFPFDDSQDYDTPQYAQSPFSGGATSSGLSSPAPPSAQAQRHGVPGQAVQQPTAGASSSGRAPRRSRSARNWVFTLHGTRERLLGPDGRRSSEFAAAFDASLSNVFAGWTYQLESGGATNALHVQGCGWGSRKTTLARIKEQLGEPTIHLEIMAGSVDQAEEYCSKPDTR